MEYQKGLPNAWINGRYYARLESWVVGNKSSAPNTFKEFAFEVPDVIEMSLDERDDRFIVPTCECADDGSVQRQLSFDLKLSIQEPMSSSIPKPS
jgi:hypothetical protein